MALLVFFLVLLYDCELKFNVIVILTACRHSLDFFLLSVGILPVLMEGLCSGRVPVFPVRVWGLALAQVLSTEQTWGLSLVSIINSQKVSHLTGVPWAQICTVHGMQPYKMGWIHWESFELIIFTNYQCSHFFTPLCSKLISSYGNRANFSETRKGISSLGLETSFSVSEIKYLQIDPHKALLHCSVLMTDAGHFLQQ